MAFSNPYEIQMTGFLGTSLRVPTASDFSAPKFQKVGNADIFDSAKLDV